MTAFAAHQMTSDYKIEGGRIAKLTATPNSQVGHMVGPCFVRFPIVEIVVRLYELPKLAEIHDQPNGSGPSKSPG